MKDLLLAIQTRLLADTGITVLLGADDSIYRTSLRKNPVFPCLSVHLISNIRDLQPTNTGRYAQARVQVTAFASTDATAAELAELVADNLNGLTNTLLPAGSGEVPVYVIGIEDAGSVPDRSPVSGLFLYHRDFLIEYAYQ